MGGAKVVVYDVIKVYESRGSRVTALRGVSLEVEAGEMLTIMGPSGSGKTTLLNLIAGVDKPTACYVDVNGLRISDLEEERLEKYRLTTVGYVFQFYNLIPTLTAIENVELPMVIAGRDPGSRRARAEMLLREIGLGDKMNRFPDELSGGEQQRLAVAVALANDPVLLVADEPTGELDIATGEKVMKLLKKEQAEHGKTVIITTHDPRVARMTDRVVLLEDGVVKGVYKPTRIEAMGSSIEQEVSAERIIVDYMKRRIDEIRVEITRLIEEFKEGGIGLEELVKRYLELKTLADSYKAELTRLGSGAEV